jgi:muramoyltetrapeptide carboxypeptidase
VDRERFEAGVAVLRSHYDLCFDEGHVFSRNGFLAGEDHERVEALNAAIEDPECRAIILARGGYGLTRILPGVNQAALRAHPIPIVGYSDVTALLTLCAGAGVAAIHGPMVSDFADLPIEDRESLFRLLENPDPGVLLSNLEKVNAGTTRGPLLGGNLEVLSRLLGTPFQPDFEGAILFLEEIGERPYRVDRLLTHLEQAQVLDAVAGVVVGDFEECDDREDEKGIRGRSSRDVLEERLGRLPVPVTLGGAFGHGRRKASLPYGVQVEIDSGAGVLTALEGAVS